MPSIPPTDPPTGPPRDTRPSLPGAPEAGQPTTPLPGRYRHYKGAHYRVLGLAQHSESEQWLVIYQALYGEGGFWARPLPMFLQTVRIDGAVVPRFELIEAGHGEVFGL